MLNMTAKLFWVVVLLVNSLGVRGHTYGLGSCERVNPMQGFDVDRFTGRWYIIQVFSAINQCMTLDITKLNGTNLKIAQSRQFYVLDSINVDHTNSYTGILTIPDTSSPASMQVRWPANVAGIATFIVLDTDYTTYGLIYECQKVWFFKRTSVAILSRTPDLDGATVNKLREQVAGYGLDVGDFSIIDHSNCLKPEDADFNINIDENTFNSFGLLSESQVEEIQTAEELANAIGMSLPSNPDTRP